MNKLALFDFDGTLTNKDTLFEICRFSSFSTRTYFTKLAFLMPIFLVIKIGFVSKQRGKEIMLKVFFGNYSSQEFDKLCLKFTEQRLPALLRPKGQKKIDELKSSSDLIIVSASPEQWIIPWAESNNIKVIATRLEIKNDLITGRISGKNCNGEEKVRRIKEEVDLSKYEEIKAFGDTRGDIPMLNLASSQHYKPFR